MTDFADQAKQIISQLRAIDDAVLSETVDLLRLDDTRCTTVEMLDSLKRLAKTADAEKFGHIELRGEISGIYDLNTVTLQLVQNEKLKLRITKAQTSRWCFFLTIEGLASALADQTFTSTPRAVWIAETFREFGSRSHRFTSWDGPREVDLPTQALAQPRNLVRDLTYLKVPMDISPWLLENPPVKAPPAPDSAVFRTWCVVAFEHLIFTLPAEIKPGNSGYIVALKGSRSVAAPIEEPLPACSADAFVLLTDVVRWIYTMPVEAETKFTLLNYHLSLDWHAGAAWPTGLFLKLEDSFASAKDAFAFHLHDQSKELLKTLADLRKALQEDVSKVQQSTRDLLTGLWRDFAIAGVVLALRAPTVVMPAEVLRVVTLATALLLGLSLSVTLVSNARFNRLAAGGRDVWRTKLYAFLPPDDWDRLVGAPIRASQSVYRVVMLVVTIVYLAIIFYLVRLAAPDFVEWGLTILTNGLRCHWACA